MSNMRDELISRIFTVSISCIKDAQLKSLFQSEEIQNLLMPTAITLADRILAKEESIRQPLVIAAGDWIAKEFCKMYIEEVNKVKAEALFLSR